MISQVCLLLSHEIRVVVASLPALPGWHLFLSGLIAVLSQHSKKKFKLEFRQCGNDSSGYTDCVRRR